MSKKKAAEVKKKRRRWTRTPGAVKAQAVERMKQGINVSELAEELGVSRSLLYIWKNQQATGTRHAKPDGDGSGPLSPQQREIQDLRSQLAQAQSALGRKTMELDFFEGALRTIERPTPCPSDNSENSSTAISPVASTRKAN